MKKALIILDEYAKLLKKDLTLFVCEFSYQWNWELEIVTNMQKLDNVVVIEK